MIAVKHVVVGMQQSLSEGKRLSLYVVDPEVWVVAPVGLRGLFAAS